MAEFTEQEKEKYLRVYFGSNCPKCGSENIEGQGNLEMDGGTISEEIECKSCGVRWYDFYKLEDIQIIE